MAIEVPQSKEISVGGKDGGSEGNFLYPLCYPLEKSESGKHKH